MSDAQTPSTELVQNLNTDFNAVLGPSDHEDHPAYGA
jgi:hypothetical protein